MRIYLFLALFLLGSNAFCQKVDINNFMVKENLLKNSKLAVIATDSLNQPVEKINGVYSFTISGFSQQLNFHDGIAVIPMKLEKSAFVYFKHENSSGTHSKLFYIYKKEGDLTPYQISTNWLIFIPLIIVVLIFMFRRFIIIGLIVLLIFIYFNHSNGLSMGTFLETIFDTMKRLF